MGKAKKKPDYDPEEIRKDMVELAKELYNVGKEGATDKQGATLSSVAEKLGISISKAVKLLIAGGVYLPEMAKRVNELYDSGLTVQEIETRLSVSRATVHSYLPYRKGIYSAKDTSVNADRIRMFRERQRCMENLQGSQSENDLWDAVVAFQNYPFHTASGLPFFYVLKVGRDGTLNKELIVNRRQESKTLDWSSVVLAFHRALEMSGEIIERPKALGDIRGISYIYPMLYRFGIIEVPIDTSEKMRLKGGGACGGKTCI